MNTERPSREALIRYYRGQCVAQEEQLVALYLSMDIDQDYTESCLQEAWNNLNEEPPTSRTVDQHRASWEKFQFRQLNALTLPSKRSFSWYKYAVASCLLLVGALGLIYLNTKMNTPQSVTHFIAKVGERREVRLKDSSLVVLFPGAKLDLASDFNDQDRRVTLQGRAFFQVTHHTDKPFLVASGKLLTRVLGTSFEVNTLAPINTITLRTGKIAVGYSGKNVAMLIPNQRISYNTQMNTFKVEHINAARELSWTAGELSYDLVPLEIIFKDLEQWYGVEINVHNSNFQNKKITTSFKDLPINQVLGMLSAITGFNYTIKGNQITIN